ncbi:uncharacterized protein [Miscanthus floridulus]|uniref:uncharacterized protein n=1 Tax=Miscanthus floridulus TaxID=154761 RepID=UPI003458CAA5
MASARPVPSTDTSAASSGSRSRVPTVRAVPRRRGRGPPVAAPGPCTAVPPPPLPLRVTRATAPHPPLPSVDASPDAAPAVAGPCRGRGRISPARPAPGSGPGWGRRSCRLPRARAGLSGDRAKVAGAAGPPSHADHHARPAPLRLHLVPFAARATRRLAPASPCAPSIEAKRWCVGLAAPATEVAAAPIHRDLNLRCNP